MAPNPREAKQGLTKTVSRLTSRSSGLVLRPPVGSGSSALLSTDLSCSRLRARQHFLVVEFPDVNFPISVQPGAGPVRPGWVAPPEGLGT